MTNPSQPTGPNPLDVAKPTSLDELFSRDPLGLSDLDLGIMVVEFRRMRSQWIVAESQGKTKAPKIKTPLGDKKPVGLDDLGI